MWKGVHTAVEEDEYWPSRLWPRSFGCEHPNAASTEVEIFHLANVGRVRGTWDYFGVAEGRVPGHFVHLWEMGESLVVKSGIFGIESGND
jgi:hypothetical protein